MNPSPNICLICGKSKGGFSTANHQKCLKQMQQMNIDKKRRPEPTNRTAKTGKNFADWVLGKTA